MSLRGFLNINYTEPDTFSYTGMTLSVWKDGKPWKKFEFNAGDPVVDYRAVVSKIVFLSVADVTFSSDCDHFEMDGDLFLWKQDFDGSPVLVRDPDYTWGIASQPRKTGWVTKNDTKQYRAKLSRIHSPKEIERDKTDYEWTRITFFSKTPARALRYIVAELASDGRKKPEDFEGQTINVDKRGERYYVGH